MEQDLRERAHQRRMEQLEREGVTVELEEELPGPRDAREPDFIVIGAAVRLISLEQLGRETRLPAAGIREFLRRCSIPTIRFPWGTKRYLNLYSLEECLFWLTKPRKHPWRRPATDYIPFEELSEPGFQQELGTAASIYSMMDRRELRKRCKQIGKALLKAHTVLNENRKASYANSP